MCITQNFVTVNTLSSKLIPETENEKFLNFGTEKAVGTFYVYRMTQYY